MYRIAYYYHLVFNRLRRGEVEPKPTPVALSRDSINRSSAGESDRYNNGFSNNSASYDDTDGERLVQNTQVSATTDDTCNVCNVIIS